MSRLGPGAVTVAVGAGRVDPADVVISLGPHHPSAHGLLRLRLTLDDADVILTADPLVGYVHRGAEKLFEVRDYRQIVMLADRHDWLSSFGNELGLVLAVERMLGLEVPARAVWLRTLLAELTRAAATLAFLAGLPGLPAAALHTGWSGREALLDVVEEATGGRVHAMANRVGGLLADVPAGWTERVARALDTADGAGRELAPVLAERAESLAGLAVLSHAQALGHAASGVVGRASGIDLDLRRDEPYLAYGELGRFEVAVSTDGDAAARLRLLAAQLPVAVDLARRALAGLPPGPVNVRLPKVVRAPEGVAFAWTEGPLGIAGYYLVSRGEPTPWRLHARTPSFHHVQLLGQLLPGLGVEALPAVLATLFFIIGDIDR